MIDAVDTISRSEFKVEDIIADTMVDLDQVAVFLRELKKFSPKHDDKLKSLIKLLKSAELRDEKILIFTEFSDTARYLADQLRAAGIKGVDQIDSGTKGDRGKMIARFAPYYNDTTSASVGDETRVLIATDVLSEGLNLQDATRLINYDLHWNPVRLMQRIGRVDRRLNPDIEAAIVRDHPDRAGSRGKVAYWNFLPPDELEGLLALYQRVARKTLRISKTLGIETGQLLTGDDDYDTLRNFDERTDGTPSAEELMHLEWLDLCRQDPDLEARLDALPDGIFSGKAHPDGRRGVFFCYARPAHDEAESEASGEDRWTDAAGDVVWHFYDFATQEVDDTVPRIHRTVRTAPEEPRRTTLPHSDLLAAKKAVEAHIKRTYLKSVQAPVGVRPNLIAWMELS